MKTVKEVAEQQGFVILSKGTVGRNGACFTSASSAQRAVKVRKDLEGTSYTVVRCIEGWVIVPLGKE